MTSLVQGGVLPADGVGEIPLDGGGAPLFFREDPEADVVTAVFQGDGHHVVEGVLELEFRDADGVVVCLRDEAHLAGAVIDKNDAGGFVQVHNPAVGGDVIQKILILADRI